MLSQLDCAFECVQSAGVSMASNVYSRCAFEQHSSFFRAVFGRSIVRHRWAAVLSRQLCVIKNRLIDHASPFSRNPFPANYPSPLLCVKFRLGNDSGHCFRSPLVSKALGIQGFKLA